MPNNRARRRSAVRHERAQRPVVIHHEPLRIIDFDARALIIAARGAGFSDLELLEMVQRTEGVFLPTGCARQVERELHPAALRLSASPGSG